MGAQQFSPILETLQVTMHWHVTLLGQVSLVAVEAGGQQSSPITRFRTTKVALLLARLALLPNRVHSREELAALISPDATTGRAHVSQSMTFLRKLLEPTGTPPGSVLLADSATVRVVPGTITCDVLLFEETLIRATRGVPVSLPLLRDACARYSGELMPGFYLDWVNDERNRLEAIHTEGCSRLQQLQSKLPPAPAAMVQLPSPLTSFLGRTEEQADITARLGGGRETRLLTLTGIGGIGKTRLAIQVAQTLVQAGTFTNAVFVSLSDVTQSEALPTAIARAMGVFTDTHDPASAVQKHLHTYDIYGMRSLLILDNLEQLHDDITPFLQTLLRNAPLLSVLATSQCPLGMIGEKEFLLHSLPGIAKTVQDDFRKFEDLLQYTDVQLFAERARLVRSDFWVTAENAEAVTALCRLLEGIPLAIELAAARARSLSPKQIVERLTKRFDLLIGKNNWDNARHHSLRATIAWSYDLLRPSQQSFFAALSVFRGGFSLEAVEAVTGSRDALELLSSLCERSLVIAEVDAITSEMRYRLLESLRIFADEKIKDAARPLLYQRHIAFFREEAQRRRDSSDIPHNLLLFWQDYANTEASVGYALTVGQADDAIDCAHLVWYHHRLGRSLPFCRSRLEEILRRCRSLSPVPRKTHLLWLSIGNLATSQGEFDLAREACEKARGLAKDQGDQHSLCMAALHLGKICLLSGDMNQATMYFESILDTYTEKDEISVSVRNSLAVIALRCGDRARASDLWHDAIPRARQLSSRLLGTMLTNQAYLLQLQDDYDEAHRLLGEARQISERRNEKGSIGLINLVEVFGAIRRKDFVTARHLCIDALRLFCEWGDILRQIETIGWLGQAMNPEHTAEAVQGVRLISAGRALQQEYSIVPESEDESMAKSATELLRHTLGDVRFEEAWGDGSRMLLAQAISFALSAG